MSEIRKMRFWGTSAGEGTPSPFCRCEICEYARKHGGKDIRTRSCFRIDEKVMIDVNEDFVPQSHKYNEDTFDVEHILCSHLHDDHYNSTVPWLRSVVQGEKNENTLNLYFTEAGANAIGDITQGNVKIHGLKFYEKYQIDKYAVTPLKGVHATNHEPNGANYIIELPDDRLMYYALDSGYYLDETFDFLKNYKLDILISECTFSVHDTGVPVHMDLTLLEKTLAQLEAQGTIGKDTTVYLTHICGTGMNHDDIQSYWDNIDKKYKVTVAYDGLVIE